MNAPDPLSPSALAQVPEVPPILDLDGPGICYQCGVRPVDPDGVDEEMCAECDTAAEADPPDEEDEDEYEPPPKGEPSHCYRADHEEVL